MNNKYLKIIIAVFVTLAIVASFPWLDEKISGQKEKNKNISEIDFFGFTREPVEKITIKKGSDEKILTYKDNNWRIGEDEADQEKVKQFFDDLLKIEIKEIAAQNENSYSKFEVSDDASFQLIFFQGEKESLFYIGKSGLATREFYLRKKGDKNVFLVKGDLRDKLIWEALKWKKVVETTATPKAEDKKL